MIRKVFSQLIHFAILFSLLFFIALLLTNSFSNGPTPTVAEKWFKYGKVVPPLDYKDDYFRPIDIDLYATKEIEGNQEFYWIESIGDTITLTNRNWKDVSGKLTFEIKPDPCRTDRKIIIGTQNGPTIINSTIQNAVYEIPVTISLNSSLFLSIVAQNGTECKLLKSDTRNFSFKLLNLAFLK
jgi:hypothetical protein